MDFKETVRELFIFFHVDFTKNIKYDRLTKTIMKNYINKDSNCIDVGCHKGEILSLMLKYAPEGKHYAFEPIPYLFNDLTKKFKNKAKILPFALSNISGETSFHLVKNAPAYSGIKRRRYDISDPKIEEINVELKPLDKIVSPSEKIHFIKIDVEGGEFDVLKGAKNLIKKNRPIILFECGKGASDYYGTTPQDIYNFIYNELGLKIYTLNSFIKSKDPLSILEFENCFNTNEEYYFAAGISEK